MTLRRIDPAFALGGDITDSIGVSSGTAELGGGLHGIKIGESSDPFAVDELPMMHRLAMMGESHSGARLIPHYRRLESRVEI
ncbi:MAG: hypothetical protein H7A53_07420 [Akkermansiaceae bacterium]|nr:hypothetical protein [Akkermansiaceae bacterium]